MLTRALRTARVGFWLGWQVQSNWTDPFLFFVYSIARPLGGVLILVFMFFVVAGGRRGPMLDFFVVGAALWPVVVWAMQGLAWGLLEDREHFKTIAYIYTAPVPFWAYLVGRGLASAVVALPATVITLTAGITVLQVPLVLSLDRLPALAAVFLVGVAGLVAVGMTVVGALFLISGEAWRLPDAVGQGLYLLCGAVFPLTVLPAWLQPLTRLFPVTYWLEAMRRNLLPQDAVRSLPGMGGPAVLGALLLATGLWILLAGLAYVGGLARARQKGILDASTGY
ncbi:MAG: ABC transporter permease [Armatimonadota bacterium]|nr:ABC transporter permease [Armatimonadota bacterium]MDR7426248.1 ABC transporter permease [Armatimonadota bacterium]MDR7463289.1 ABC transporter permease [Armatimonadota bacterium]MDR7468975.1 ABC transporter permease [Armatimonadota bacterium]MDR7474022.1 ABC transporter permease [Armatimonadota bacterium]